MDKLTKDLKVFHDVEIIDQPLGAMDPLTGNAKKGVKKADALGAVDFTKGKVLFATTRKKATIDLDLFYGVVDKLTLGSVSVFFPDASSASSISKVAESMLKRYSFVSAVYVVKINKTKGLLYRFQDRI